MKKQFLHQKIFLFALFITTVLSSHAQQKITIISTKENNYCNSTCTLLNIPELNNNPDAIIFVTPVTKNSHPMAAYYIQSTKDMAQWSIMNLDNTQMQVGTQFSVEYYVQPDTIHFLHVISQQNLQNNGSYIDHVGLNDNPNAQIKFFQNLAPIARGGIANDYDLKIQYDTVVHRWYMFNTNNRQLSYGNGYNLAISPGPTVIKTFDGKDPSLAIQDPNKNNVGTGWVLSGANLYSTNQGFVGIAWKNPTAPLGFSPSLGKKISLYPGATGDAGFGVAPNRLQIFSDNSNADVALGYDNAGTFNERFAVKANGALAVNGNTGTTGQILQSNGPGNSATWTDFKTQYYRKEISAVTLSDNSNFININIPVTIKANSIITVSVTADLSVHSCLNDDYNQLGISAQLLNGGGLVVTSMGQFTKSSAPVSTITTGETPLLSLNGTVAEFGPGSNVVIVTLSKFGSCPYLDIGGKNSSAIIVKVIPQ